MSLCRSSHVSLVCKAVETIYQDGTLILPDQTNTNLSTSFPFITLPNIADDDTGPGGPSLGAKRPGQKIWPEDRRGNHYIRFHDYKRDIRYEEGAALL
ncbi:MAG: hypothetical protein L6R39_007029, partial [Caloplaca ligustica]